MRAAPPRIERFPERATEIVASLAQHRALSAEQVRRIHLPGSGERWSQRVLARLRSAGFVDYAQATGAPQRLWFATPAGVDAALAATALDVEPRVLSSAEVAGPLQAHTVAVNEVGIRFLEAARERGDEFGPLAWRHEVAHPLNRGRGARRRNLIADAVLTYLRLTEEEVFVEQCFLELDRATMSVDALTSELGQYARLYGARDERGEPLWGERYPIFPAVICVLAGARPELLERRRDTALALLRAKPEMSLAPEVTVRVCLAEDLYHRGPFAPIFADLREPASSVDWLGSPVRSRR